MWIMLIKKPPTSIAPPKMSIFWAKKECDNSRILSQFKGFLFDKGIIEPSSILRIRLNDGTLGSTILAYRQDQDFGEYIGNKIEETVWSENKLLDKESLLQFIKFFSTELILSDGFGSENNELASVTISYRGEKIKILASEYSILTDEKVKFYVFGVEGTYSLMSDSPRSEKFEKSILDEIEVVLYEQALLDGADQEMAIMIAKGISFDMTELPILGWYKPNPEFVGMFARKENDCYETIDGNIIK